MVKVSTLVLIKKAI